MQEYRSPINPQKRGKRRAAWQDYTKPCFYMITLAKSQSIPHFSKLYQRQRPLSSYPKAEINPSEVYCDYTALGFIINEQMAAFNREHPEAQIKNRIIMPDHIHFIFHVKERLSKLMARFKGQCSRAFANFIHESIPAKSTRTDNPLTQNSDGYIPQIIPVFEKGFNDLICFRRGQLDKFINYIKDNPRRLAIKISKPDLFTSLMSVKIGENYYKVIGNIFLLQYPVLEQVRFSRKFSTEEWERRKKYLNKVIDRGGVVVSPFIHPEEAAIFEEAKKGEAGIIYIRNRDYGERDKPEGKLFELCAEGRLLIIAIGEEGQRKDTIDRSIAMRMNSIAEAITNHSGPFFLRRAK